MAKRKGKGGSRPSPQAVLRAVVHRNERIEVELRGEGRVVVSVPNKRPWWMAGPVSWLLPFRAMRRIELDGLGAEVLGLCDGRRTVEQITDEFGAEHRLSARESRVSVLQFLKMLTQRGVVALVFGPGGGGRA